MHLDLGVFEIHHPRRGPPYLARPVIRGAGVVVESHQVALHADVLVMQEQVAQLAGPVVGPDAE